MVRLQTLAKNMETMEIRKADLRKQMKICLKELEKQEKKRLDHAVYMQVMNDSEIANSESFYGYMSLSWETGTSEILESLWRQNKKVALPRVVGSEMEFFEVKSMDSLEEGAFHIMEPNADCPKVNWQDAVIFVPGIAFTRGGKRLGKGGGFYDKYLEKHPGHRTAALAYEFQIFSDLPSEFHDKQVDRVVTEAGVWIC